MLGQLTYYDAAGNIRTWMLEPSSKEVFEQWLLGTLTKRSTDRPNTIITSHGGEVITCKYAKIAHVEALLIDLNEMDLVQDEGRGRKASRSTEMTNWKQRKFAAALERARVKAEAAADELKAAELEEQIRALQSQVEKSRGQGASEEVRGAGRASASSDEGAEQQGSGRAAEESIQSTAVQDAEHVREEPGGSAGRLEVGEWLRNRHS